MQVVQEPNKYAGTVGFIQNLLGGILEQQQRQQQTRDLQDIGNWARGGFEGQAPKLRTDFGQQLAGKLMDPLAGLRAENLRARTEATRALTTQRQQPKVRTSKDVMADINRAMTGVTKAEKLGDEGLQANIQRDLDNLHNELMQIRQKDFPEVIGPEHNELFDKVIEGQPKEKRTWYDRIYGSKAYHAAKRAYIKQATKQYKTSAKRATRQFDKIWLERYQTEAGERFQKFAEPSAFGQEQAPSVSAQAGQEQSPYPEYPDAFLENGVWKVTRNGKKYRIEE